MAKKNKIIETQACIIESLNRISLVILQDCDCDMLESGGKNKWWRKKRKKNPTIVTFTQETEKKYSIVKKYLHMYILAQCIEQHSY